jgi:CRISPR system Cascade subunit CasD
MRFAGPFQSWGTRSRFDLRDTEMAPSKSGVVGLVAAALGRSRDESVADLASLRLGIRTDRPGILRTDYHTALDVTQADGKGTPSTAVTKRDYLADAVFLVALEGSDKGLLELIDQALEAPHWPLALGRRAFPPGQPVALRPPVDEPALVEQHLEQALLDYPSLLADPARMKKPSPANDAGIGLIRYHIEDPAGEQEWFDQPLDDFMKRSFASRRVKVVVMERGKSWF